MKDYYRILEVPIDVTEKVIREQYHFLLHAWHPDKFPDPAQKIKAQEKAKEIIEAYETLKDPLKRAQYDKQRTLEHASPHHNRTPTPSKSGSDERRTPKNVKYTEEVRQHDAEYIKWHRPEHLKKWGPTVLKCSRCSTLNPINTENFQMAFAPDDAKKCRKCATDLKTATKITNPYI